ncbi:MAG TPA: helix-turn-helix domain-containing protein [Stellaceae bacterium]|nr:helix-turn-helix domain-containing protein [Stellaceae bacterium]
MDERILATADRLFSRQGIRAVGVDTIAAEAGISKRTLYNHYPAKEALVVAHLRRRYGALTHADDRLVDAPPAAQILGAFERLERAIADPAFRGCPFVNAVAELGVPGPGADHQTNALAIAFKEERRQWFRRRLERIGVADPDGLATQLALLVDGCVAVGLVRRDPAMARAAGAAARTLLIAAGVAVAPAGSCRSPRR